MIGDDAAECVSAASLSYEKEEEAKEMEKEQARTWLYCRIDAPEDALGRLKGQRSELIAYAEQLNMEVVGGSEDRGSGLNMERSGLREVQQAAAAGIMDALLVTQGSRIGRSMSQVAAFIEELSFHGVAVFSALEGEMDLAQWVAGRKLPDEEALLQSAKQEGKEVAPDGPSLQCNS